MAYQMTDIKHSVPAGSGLTDNAILISYEWYSECPNTIITGAVCILYKASLLAPA